MLHDNYVLITSPISCIVNHIPSNFLYIIILLKKRSTSSTWCTFTKPVTTMKPVICHDHNRSKTATPMHAVTPKNADRYTGQIIYVHR